MHDILRPHPDYGSRDIRAAHLLAAGGWDVGWMRVITLTPSRRVSVGQEGAVIREMERMIQELPPDLRCEVDDLAEFFMAGTASAAFEDLRVDWVGALREHRDQDASYKLQTKL